MSIAAVRVGGYVRSKSRGKVRRVFSHYLPENAKRVRRSWKRDDELNIYRVPDRWGGKTTRRCRAYWRRTLLRELQTLEVGSRSECWLVGSPEEDGDLGF